MKDQTKVPTQMMMAIKQLAFNMSFVALKTILIEGNRVRDSMEEFFPVNT